MVAPNPRLFQTARPIPARRELRQRVRELVGSVAGSTWRSTADAGRPVPLVEVVVAAGRPFRVTVEMIDCDAAVGGFVPIVTIQEISTRQPLTRWIQHQFGFTDREAKVALLLARRRKNTEIARTLHISPHTARRHTENVMNKMGVRSRFAVEQNVRAAIRSLQRRQGPSTSSGRRAPLAGRR